MVKNRSRPAASKESEEEEDMVPWFENDTEWKNLVNWKPVEGQDAFPDAKPCRELEDYLNFEPQTSAELESLATERLFLITIVKSQERVNLSLTPWSNQKQQKKRSRKEKFTPSTGGGSDAKPYFRLHTAINLLSKNQEMFFITEKTADQDLLWGSGNREYQRSCIFGVPYIMAISQNVGSYMSGGEIVVEPEYSIRQMDDRALPTIPWKPKTAESFPFILNNAKVYLESFVLVKSVCNGIYCDRRQKSNEATSCSCYIASSHRGAPAISARVTLRIAMSATATERIIWTSYGFLRWLVKDGKVTHALGVDDYVLNTKLKKVCQKMLKHTNDDDGFLVVGWGMQGLASDHNNPGDEKVISDHYTLHLARMEPMSDAPDFVKALEKLRFVPE